MPRVKKCSGVAAGLGRELARRQEDERAERERRAFLLKVDGILADLPSSRLQPPLHSNLGWWYLPFPRPLFLSHFFGDLLVPTAESESTAVPATFQSCLRAFMSACTTLKS